ncbi:hypothetical protein GUITHDRAFT_122818 [Guillardia theta CCMP2712]|uniref:RWP-RK domain-containing protein n=1 Tax=Guillardia theta (strain CCMP2712) TaxID=905079 RepID=L1I4H0_GUITC|nr:hypothetical protein GUITHDRAFT_122818 [Guillardia theta CCMP2712]EKX30977.1 hypothetical protein GUITHDRAFT_122818 [Guillardia theta CCMP2712]|eukprot:XP_005817957.1 hypothetical protein GUITHDRAFT_122818 [Guillardia theta CCMP2712]
MIRSLFYLKQEDAAVQLGISLTSLKTACRKLGISRWPYSRTRSASITGRDTSRSSPSEAMDQVMEEEVEGSNASMSCMEDVYSDAGVCDDWMMDMEIVNNQRDFVELALSVLPREHDWIEWYVRSDDSEPVIRDWPL